MDAERGGCDNLTVRDDDVKRVPARTKALLQQWVDEFVALNTQALQVAIAGNLCAFLQFKSLEWDRMSGMHD